MQTLVFKETNPLEVICHLIHLGKKKYILHASLTLSDCRFWNPLSKHKQYSTCACTHTHMLKVAARSFHLRPCVYWNL